LLACSDGERGCLRRRCRLAHGRAPPADIGERRRILTQCPRRRHLLRAASLFAVWQGAHAAGRESDEEITAFDSTGLAIQDLAIALTARERADARELPGLDL
jgi:hypothetical protein